MAAAGRRERTDRGGRSGRALGRRVLQPLAAAGHGLSGRRAARLRRFHRARARTRSSFAVLVPSTRGVTACDGKSVGGDCRVLVAGVAAVARADLARAVARLPPGPAPLHVPRRSVDLPPTLAGAQLTCRPTKRFTKRAGTNCERLLCDGGRRRAQRPPRSGGLVLRRVCLA